MKIFSYFFAILYKSRTTRIKKEFEKMIGSISDDTLRSLHYTGIGVARFPVTVKGSNGKPRFGTVFDVVVGTSERFTGMMGGYVHLPSAVKNPTLWRLHLPSAYARNSETRSEQNVPMLEGMNKACSIAVTLAIDAACAILARKDLTVIGYDLKPTYVSIPVHTEVDINGTSLGHATLAALLGMDDSGAPIKFVMTGYINTIGNPYQGMVAVDQLIVNGVDEVATKAQGVLSAGMHLVAPRENFEEVRQIMMKIGKPTGATSNETRHDVYSSSVIPMYEMGHLAIGNTGILIPFIRERGHSADELVPGAYFVYTVKEMWHVVHALGGRVKLLDKLAGF